MSILENLHRFLVPKSHENTLEEKTKSAIILLQTLPCAKGAVLDQIGEVFHEAAKNYITEVETQMLSGLSFSLFDVITLCHLFSIDYVISHT